MKRRSDSPFRTTCFIHYVLGIWSCSIAVARAFRSLPVVNLGAPRMILPVFLFFFFTTLAESLDEDHSCNLKNGSPGVCAKLIKCRPVLEELNEGNPPDVICGYSGFDPIVCCPRSTSATVTTSLPVGSKDGPGVIARQKCAEYSQYVYVLKPSPALISNTKPLLNVSECGNKVNAWFGHNRNANNIEFPYMAAVGYVLDTGDIGWHCGGTLISETFVLTTAQCTHSTKWGEATWVRLGDLILMRSDDGVTPVDRRVSERIRHPKFKPPSLFHDIALLRIQARVPFNRWIRPACLHTASLTGIQKAIATGWGRAEDDGSRNLRMIVLPLVDARTCNASWSSGRVNIQLPYGVVENSLICAGAEDEDSRQDDAGGPLILYSEKEYYCMYDVIGVAALKKLGNDRNLEIYTRVHYYLRWIESTVWAQG